MNIFKEELNTMMKKYKENEVARDLLYEEDKREKLKAAMQERLEAEKKQKELQENMDEPDPWLKLSLKKFLKLHAEPTTAAPEEESSSSTTAPETTAVETSDVKEV